MNNSFNVFCSRRRWLKKLILPLLDETAYIDLKKNDLRIHFNPKDLRGPSFHLSFGEEDGFNNYELAEKEEIVAALKEGGTFIDIGANIGLFSFYISKYRPSCAIFSFEPDKLTRKCLELTKTSNSLDHVHISSYAIGAKDEILKLYKSGLNDGGHSLKSDLANQTSYEEVQVKPLSSALGSNIKNIQVIKIDVEGAELSVLEGSLDIIKEWKPMILIETDNEILSNGQGIIQFFETHFKGRYHVRTPGDQKYYQYDEIKILAKKRASNGHPLNNYIFEFMA